MADLPETPAAAAAAAAAGVQYDGVLENVSQETIYTTCAHEVVDSLLQGFNGTIFCYGQVCQGGATRP